MLVTEPVVIFFSIYVAFNFSVLYAFFAAFPYVFESVYRFSTVESGLVFLALGVGCLLAIPTVGLCNAFLYQPKVRAAKAAGGSGAIAPEYSLFPAMFGSFGIPIGLFVSVAIHNRYELLADTFVNSGLHGQRNLVYRGSAQSYLSYLSRGAIYVSLLVISTTP